MPPRCVGRGVVCHGGLGAALPSLGAQLGCWCGMGVGVAKRLPHLTCRKALAIIWLAYTRHGTDEIQEARGYHEANLST